MGGIVGGITDAIGLTNNKGEKAAARAASEANAQSYALSKEQIALAKEQLEFQKSQYADWKEIYGDIEENLAEYYKELTPTKLTAMGLENQQREFQAARTAIARDYAQRGLTGSGMEAATGTALTYANAEARARIRTEAPEKTVQAKLGFLGVGLGQGAGLLSNVNAAASNVNTAYSTGVNSRTAMANSYIGQQTQFSTNNTNAMGQLVGTGIGFIGG